jgi:hypothetical protein
MTRTSAWISLGATPDLTVGGSPVMVDHRHTLE